MFGDGGGESGGGTLPGLSPGMNPSTAIVGLPAPRISRMTDVPSSPRVQQPPTPRSGGTTTLQRSSPNRRLSGVVIGDSVRALLEIDNGTPEARETRVVQPGDEVDGIRVLRIERYTEGGGRTRVRMVVRENGEERYIDLRAAPQQAAGMGGEGGPPPGYGGPPPGFTGGRPPFGPPR
jgi:hypothetical protein